MNKALLVLLLTTATPSISAQPIPKVAIVLNTPAVAELVKTPPSRPLARAFYEGMRDRGWIDGRTVEFVWRSAEEHPERVPAIMEELVRSNVDVIVVSGNRAAREAKEKTRSIPIVMASSEFAVESGLIHSYARPGGNVTGVSNLVYHLDAKRLYLLKELVPSIKRVAIVGQLGRSREVSGTQTLAALRALGLEAWNVRADRGADVERAFTEAVREGADAMILSSTGVMAQPENQARINALAVQHRIPVLHAVLSGVERGGLIAYAADELATWRRAAGYVDRVLRGAKPAELPIEHPTSYHLHVNRKAAAAIGLTIPASILTQADKVFD